MSSFLLPVPIEGLYIKLDRAISVILTGSAYHKWQSNEHMTLFANYEVPGKMFVL